MALAIVGCAEKTEPALTYPETKKGPVVDNYFETEVALKKGSVWRTIYQRWQSSFRY